jgi:rubrerythrin
MQSESELQVQYHSEEWKTFHLLLSETKAKPNIVWTCRHCTFMNSAQDSCEMCGLPK